MESFAKWPHSFAILSLYIPHAHTCIPATSLDDPEPSLQPTSRCSLIGEEEKSTSCAADKTITKNVAK